MRYLLSLLVFLLLPLPAFAQFTTTQGGTGTSSPSGILYGDGTIRLKTVTIGSNLTFSGGVLSATGGGSGGTGAATSSFAALFPIQLLTSASAITFSFGGLSTTSPWTNGQLAMVQSGNQVTSVATTTASCAGTASCTSFTVLGSSPITITGSGGASGADFTFGTLTFSTSTAATSSSIWLNGGSFFSSSTQASQLPYASTTAITTTVASTTVLNISGATTFQSITTGANRALIISGTGLVSTIGFPISVGNGGTGATALTGSMMIAMNSAGSAIQSTSTPTADHYLATSTIFASVFPYASSTYSSFQGASSTKYFGAGLDAGCNGTSFLQITSGTFGCGTPSGSAASAFEIATTSDIAVSQLAYINKTTGRTTLASAATTTLTGTAPITFSQPISVIGPSASVITCAVATASVPGCLAAADFTIFSNKVSFAWPFTPTANFGFLTQATSGVPYFSNGGFFASSTGPQLVLSNSATGAQAFNFFVTATGLSISTTTNTTMTTTTSSSIFSMATSGTLCIGIGCTPPQGISGLFIRDQDGTGPMLFMGGNGGGDSDWAFKRFSNNDSVSNDRLSLGFIPGPNSSAPSEFMTWASSGNIGIGTTTPTYPIDIFSTTTSQIALSNGAGIAQWAIRNAGGNLSFSTTTIAGTATSTPAALTVMNSGTGLFVGTTTNSGATGLAVNGTGFWTGLTSSAALQTGILCLSATNQIINESAACVASSRRFKNDIKPLTTGITELMKLQPVSFYYKPEYNGELQKNPNYNGEQVGFIAEDVQALDPRLSVVEPDGVTAHGVRYEQMTALIVKAVQEMWHKITGIDERVNALEKENAELKARLDRAGL